MKKIILSILLLLSATCAFSQISSSDIIVNVTGLSNEYSQKFKKSSSIEAFVDVWNRIVDYDASPIKINVNYNNNSGWIMVAIPFNAATYANLDKYSRHNSQFVNIGARGVSVLLQSEVLTAITEYKFDVAREGWTIDNRIMEFKCAVSLVKSNGDILILSGYNYRNNRNGTYPYNLYTNAEMLINGKSIQTNTSNFKMLNDYNFFCLEPNVGMDGKRTTAYYMEEFYRPSNKEMAAYEAAKKAEAERKAKLEEEYRRKVALARESCVSSIKEQIESGKSMSEQLLKDNHCKIDYSQVWYNDGDVSVQIGLIRDPFIKYVGGKEHMMELLKLSDSYGFLSINTINNQPENQAIADIFKISAKKLDLESSDNTSYYFNTSFLINTNFTEANTEHYSGIKVKVAEKKGELKYVITVPWDESNSPSYLCKDEVLEHLKEFMPTKGTYKFNLTKTDGAFRITWSNKKISEDIPLHKIKIVKDSKNNTCDVTEYYVTE